MRAKSKALVGLSALGLAAGGGGAALATSPQGADTGPPSRGAVPQDAAERPAAEESALVHGAEGGRTAAPACATASAPDTSPSPRRRPPRPRRPPPPLPE